MTMRLVCALLTIAALAGAGCGPGPDSSSMDGSPALPDDEDGDTISDADEGRSDEVDTDGDGTPDYLDDDSDGDGIPDRVEAGDDSPATAPVDSDGDGVPDFRDLDSDGNGRDDATDGTGDFDGDGILDFADPDDDGDSLPDSFELGDPASPVDSDGDGAPDFRDLDSDGDTILDADERAEDPDGDGIPAYLDEDSDDDCIDDALEAGDDDVNTRPVDSDGDTRPDFLDLDSDNDGLADRAEDANCNGMHDPTETSAVAADSDGDGVSDLVEVAAGTNANDAGDNPQARGDFVFVVPYEAPPDPLADDLDFSTKLRMVDVYPIVDRSGSMSTEIASIRTNIQTALLGLTCPPLGTGDPATCIPDIWSGIGSVGYTGSGGEAFRNHLDIQPNPALTGPALPIDEPGGCCDEPLSLGVWAAATGQGSATSGCTVTDAVPARASCAGSPAGAGGIGYPCFRPDALPIILLTTDEAPTVTTDCPAASTVIGAVNAIGGRIVGIKGSGSAITVTSDLNALATGTGAIDASNGNAPLVFQGDDASAASAIATAIRTLAKGIPLDVSAVAVDDTGDPVDAVADFIERLETLQLGTAACADNLDDEDTNGDSYPDLYVNLLPGTPVCWRLTPRTNTTVPATTEPQLFRATIQVYGDNVTLLDTRDVYFLVPPLPVDVPID